jgi:Fe-S cluster assembly protein SufD
MSVGVEPRWLLARRDEAEKELARTGIPDSGNEEWKHSDPGQFLTPTKVVDPQPVARLASELSLPQAWQVLVFVGGVFRRDLSRVADVGRGVSVESLSQAIDTDGTAMGALLGTLDPENHAFFAANRERWSDGLFLKVPPGTTLPGPVQILEIGSGTSYLRHLVVAGPGSSAEILEVRATVEGVPATTRSVLEANLDADASVVHSSLQAGGDRLRSWSGLAARVGKGAELKSRQFLVSGEIVRSETFVELAGPGAHADLAGLSAVSGERSADVLTVVRHASPLATSHQLFQALAGGKSTATFLGIVKVDPDAQKTSARQSSRNLLLSREAAINSRPQLEIWADDVKCSHGSTTGRLDEKALFFLRARGFSESGARAVLVRAFAGELVEKLPEGGFRDRVESLLEMAL